MTDPKVIEQLPIEVLDVVDTQVELVKIKEKIDHLKQSFSELHQEIELFDKEKNSLAKEIVDQKQKNIDEKNILFEKEKQEAQTMISKVELANLKKDILGTSKTEFEQYKQELQSLDMKKKSSWEKTKETVGKAWETTKTFAKEHPIITASVVGVGIFALWKLFKKKKKEDSEDKEGKDGKKEKKGFWDRWYGKALKYGLIGTGIWYVGKGLLSGKWNIFDRFNKDKPETNPGSPDAANESKEALSKQPKEVKDAYSTIAKETNAFYGTNASADDTLGESDYEQQDKEVLAGTVPFMLDNRYASVGDLLSENAFANEIVSTDIHDVLAQVKGRGADLIKKYLTPLAAKFDTATWNLINTAKTVEDIEKAVRGNPEAEKIISSVFKKSMKVFAYLQNRKNALERVLVKQKLQEKNIEGFKDKSPEDQENAITLYVKDKNFYADNIKSDLETLFMKQKIVSFQGAILQDCAYKTLQERGLLKGAIEKENAESLKELDDEKKEFLGQEDDGSNRIDDIKEKLKGGKLDAEDQEKLQSFCDDFTHIMETSGKNTLLNKYFFLLEMFNTEASTGEKIYETSEYKKFVEECKKNIEGILKKSKDGTLVESDLDGLHTMVDDYYTLQHDLTISTYEVQHIRDEKGNIGARILFTLRRGVRNFKEGIELWGNGEELKGGAVIAGNVLAVGLVSYSVTHPLKTIKAGLQLGKFAALQGFNLTDKLTGKVLKSKLPWGLGARWYTEKTLAYDIVNGNIDLKTAASVAKRKGFTYDALNSGGSLSSAHVIQNEQHLLESMFGNKLPDGTKLIDKDYQIIAKYFNENKSIRKNLINVSYGNRKMLNIKDWFKLDKTKMAYSLNAINFQKLKDIDTHIQGLVQSTEKKIFQSMMKSIKSLDQAEDIVTLGIDAKYLKYFEVGKDQLMSAEKFGRYLGKYAHKINSQNIKQLIHFVEQAQKANKITAANKEVFVMNAIKNFAKLEKNGFALDQVEVLALNTSRYERVANKVKSGVNTMIKDMQGFLKNPKMKPFYDGIKSRISSLTEYVKTVTPDSIKAMKEMAWLDKVTGFSKLTPEGIQALSSLKNLLATDKALLQSLQGAKKLEDVKDILTKAGIDVAKIDDGVLLKLVETKNATKINSIVNYGAEIESINGFKKLMSNPGMKAFGKWLGIAGVAVDFAFVGYEATVQFGEAAEIKKYNEARGANKESEAYFDVITGGSSALLGLAGTVALFGAANSWNPVGWGCLIGAGALTGVKEVSDLYYGEIDTFKKNYQDFLRTDMPAIKQHIVYVNNWQTGLDRSFQDQWSKLTGNMAESEKKNVSVQTSADAVKAIIYFEELEKYPHAQDDLNNPAVRQSPEYEKVVAQKDAHQKAVEERFAYIKKHYIDGKQSLLSSKDLENNKGVSALDTILEESRIAQVVEADIVYTDKANVVAYKKYLESELKQNAQAFAQLESFSSTQPVEFYKMVFGMPEYEVLLESYRDTKSNYQELVDRLAYMKKYMNYKTLGKLPSDYPTINFDPATIDHAQIESFLLSYTIVATGVAAGEIATAKGMEYLENKDVLDQYNVSTNIGQNILFEIASTLGYQKSPGYSGKNNLTDLKMFFRESKKQVNGIYYDGKNWCINEEYGSDNEFATDAQLNDLEHIKIMKQYISDASNAWNTGKMISKNDGLNQEFAQNYIKVIDKEIAYKTNSSKIKNDVLSYIKAQSKGKYIQLSSDLIIKSTKAGFNNVGAFVYSRDGKKIDAKTTKKGIIPQLLN